MNKNCDSTLFYISVLHVNTMYSNCNNCVMTTNPEPTHKPNPNPRSNLNPCS